MAGAHRFVWDLRWASAGANAEIEEEDSRGAPRGPRAIPGTYQLKLTVDGTTYTQPLRVEMDPRSQATSAELREQLRVGLEIFAEVQKSRRALAEMGSTKKKLAELATQSLKVHPELLTQVTSVQSAIEKIEKGEAPGSITGLQSASMGLGAALRVVESSDRAIPSQALELYQQADLVAKSQIAAWANIKAEQLPKLNDTLQKAAMAPIH